jgi:hypothetical protein
MPALNSPGVLPGCEAVTGRTSKLMEQTCSIVALDSAKKKQLEFKWIAF